MAGSHTMPRQENTDTKTSNHLPSTVEQPKSVETSKQRKLTTAQERRRALLQKALQQGGLFVEQSWKRWQFLWIIRFSSTCLAWLLSSEKGDPHLSMWDKSYMSLFLCFLSLSSNIIYYVRVKELSSSRIEKVSSSLPAPSLSLVTCLTFVIQHISRMCWNLSVHNRTLSLSLSLSLSPPLRGFMQLVPFHKTVVFQCWKLQILTILASCVLSNKWNGILICKLSITGSCVLIILAILSVSIKLQILYWWNGQADADYVG